jgi:K+/H+ antiporter YhaU regulatory subunit KhtT
MRRLYDILSPKGDTVQVFLKRKGKTEAVIYKEDEKEFRSPSLQKDRSRNEKADRDS